MIRLHKITFRKLFPYPTFWILLGLHLFLCNIIVLGLENFLGSVEFNGNRLPEENLYQLGIFSFPDIWHNITYVAGYFKFILAIVIIIDVCNDYAYRTIRQHLIDGLTYLEYLSTKFVLIFWLTLISTIFLALTGLYLGFNHSDLTSLAVITEKIYFMGAYFIELFSYLSLALLLAILVKRSGLSIGLLILYTWIIEPLIAFALPDSVQAYLPLENLGNLIQMPFKEFLGEAAQVSLPVMALVIAICYIVIFNLCSYLVIRYKDL